MPAVTRNMKKVSEHNATYDVVIDFDDASEEWKKNKISIGNGMYKYQANSKNSKNSKTNNIYTQCIMILTDGTDCKSRRKKSGCFCRRHC